MQTPYPPSPLRFQKRAGASALRFGGFQKTADDLVRSDVVHFGVVVQHDPVPQCGKRDGPYVVEGDTGVTAQGRVRFGGQEQMLRPPRTGAPRDVAIDEIVRVVLSRPAAPGEGHRQPGRVFRGGNPSHEAPERFDLNRREDRLDLQLVLIGRAKNDLEFFFFARIIDVGLEHESVELRLGERVRPPPARSGSASP